MLTRRLVLGVAVMIVVQAVGAWALEVSGLRNPGNPIARAWLLEFASAMAGAWVAGRPFYVAAASFWAVMWALVVGLYYSAAAPVGPVSWAGMLETGGQPMLASGSALLAGAAAVHAGQVWLSSPRRVAT
jgi:hypothetical protein